MFLGVPGDGELTGVAGTDPAPVAGWGPVLWAGVLRVGSSWCAPSTAGRGKQSEHYFCPKIMKRQGGCTADAARVDDGGCSGTSSLLDGDLSTALGFEASSAPHLAEHPHGRLQEELSFHSPAAPGRNCSRISLFFLLVAVTLCPLAISRCKKTFVCTWFTFRSAHVSSVLQLHPAAVGAGTGVGPAPRLGPSIEHGPKTGVSPALPWLGCSLWGSRNLTPSECSSFPNCA